MLSGARDVMGIANQICLWDAADAKDFDARVAAARDGAGRFGQVDLVHLRRGRTCVTHVQQNYQRLLSMSRTCVQCTTSSGTV